jgi:hypothetical protein
MLVEWWNRLRQRWGSWVGDRGLERAIRISLNQAGWQGGGAAIRDVRLVAIKRPGWVQIYRFEVLASRQPDAVGRPLVTDGQPLADDEPPICHLYGLARDDGRTHETVRLFSSPQLRREQFAEWSRSMIVLRRGLDG